MSSDVQDALAGQQINDYGSLVVIAAVTYDYFLTLQKEVTYIWKKPWSWVSALFLLIRYAGLVSVLTFALYSSSFIPGLTKVSFSSLSSIADTTNMNASNNLEIEVILHFTFGYLILTWLISCAVTYLLGNWAYPIFWAGADMMMILRVYAMYNRSKLILCTLLLMYVAEMVILFAESVVYSQQTYASLSSIQLLNISVCTLVYNVQTWNNATTYAQFVLAAVLCILAVAQYARHSLQTHRTQRTWQPNKYIKLLVRDSLLYFLVTLLYTLINLLGLMGLTPSGWAEQILVGVANIPLYTLTPRFVMNVRELYARDVEGSHNRDIDTGFGLRAGRGAGGSTSIETVAFAVGGETMNLNDAEEIAMVEDARRGEVTPPASDVHASPLQSH